MAFACLASAGVVTVATATEFAACSRFTSSASGRPKVNDTAGIRCASTSSSLAG